MPEALGCTAVLGRRVLPAATPAPALQPTVAQVGENADGSMTYHFTTKTDAGGTLAPGNAKAAGDFVMIHNFCGFVGGSAKSPAGWSFSSGQFGRAPTIQAGFQHRASSLTRSSGKVERAVARPRAGIRHVQVIKLRQAPWQRKKTGHSSYVRVGPR